MPAGTRCSLRALRIAPTGMALAVEHRSGDRPR